ncbi:MAG: oligopeptidase A [Pantoea sp. Brub]|nr:oligopeptidase A [Pantoea sp. Brub]
MKHNPLLTFFILPPFSKIKNEHIIPAITKMLDDCYCVVNNILKQDIIYNWENMIQPLIEVNDHLNKIISPINHLNSVNNTVELRNIYQNVSSLIYKYSIWISQNKKLYKAYCNLKNNNHYSFLNYSQKKFIKNTLIDFKLSGINLCLNKQKRYKEVIIRLADLELFYGNNVLDATMNWNKLIINKEDLIDIPKNILSYMQLQAKNNGESGWLCTLDLPIYLSIITHCTNQTIRREIYIAYITRASDQGPNANKWDNTHIIKEILLLRTELAQLLGFNSFIEYSLIKKTANNAQEIMNFLIDLFRNIHAQGNKELIELKSFIKETYNIDTLNPWDFSFYSEKHKQHLYKIDNKKIRVYFPESKVLSGLFEILYRVFGIIIKEVMNNDLYNSEVRFFHLFNENSNELIGSFYLDLYARKNKKSGAWMNVCSNKMRKINGDIQKPIAYIVCNFSAPMNNQPTLLTHYEIVTLFHEFGHALHHLLTDIDIPEISGINGVPWDVVELPSQLMENWCWEPDALALISGHYKTNKAMPKKMIKNILMAKKHQSCLFLLRQIEFSLFDLELHTISHSKQDINFMQILTQIRNNIAILPVLEEDRFPCAFNHIFEGGYAGGYYSYLWSSVLAADCFSRFKKEGIFNRDTGKSFVVNILAQGGSKNFMTIFKKFLGREPNIKAMLEQYNIK